MRINSLLGLHYGQCMVSCVMMKIHEIRQLCALSVLFMCCFSFGVFLHHFSVYVEKGCWKCWDAVRGDFSILYVKFSVNLVIFKILVLFERKADFG